MSHHGAYGSALEEGIMPVTFDIVVENGTATYTLIGSAAKDPVIDTAEDAARYVYPIRYQLYEDEEKTIPILFDALSLAQRKGIIALEFKYVMVQYAKTYHAITATDTARETAIAEAEVKYDLG